jgi:hypothetical protein
MWRRVALVWTLVSERRVVCFIRLSTFVPSRLILFTQIMEAIRSTETSVLRRVALHHFTEDDILQKPLKHMYWIDPSNWLRPIEVMCLSVNVSKLDGGKKQNWTKRESGHISRSLLSFHLSPPRPHHLRFNAADLEQIAIVNQLLCRNWPVFMNKRLIIHLVELGENRLLVKARLIEFVPIISGWDESTWQHRTVCPFHRSSEQGYFCK